jgi:hypothetical protein
MRNNVKAYKVVMVCDDKSRNSAIQGSVRYHLDGRLVKPNIQGSSLFVFDEMSDAEAFKFRRTTPSFFEVWEVRANNVKDEGVGRFRENLTASRFPIGTKFCSSLRMIKRV